MFTPAIDLKSSADMCVDDPAPEEAKLSLSGDRFAVASTSARSFNGDSAETISTLVSEATKATDSRSFAAS